MKVGSVFITNDHEAMIVIEEVDHDVAIFRYITSYSARLVGTTDWAYVRNLQMDDGPWFQIA